MRARYLLLGLMILLAAGNASAGIGIAKDYLPNNTMIMQPGGDTNYQIYLTNTDSNNIQVRMILRAALPLKAEAGNSNELVVIPAKTYNYPYRVHLSIPSDAQTGKKYRVNLVLTSAGTGSGMVTLSNEISEHFFVQIGNAPVSDVINPAPTEMPPPLVRNETIINSVPNPVTGAPANATPTTTTLPASQTGMVIVLFNAENRNNVGIAAVIVALAVCFLLVFKYGERRSRLVKSVIGAAIVGGAIYFGTEGGYFTAPTIQKIYLEAVGLVAVIVFALAYLDAAHPMEPPPKYPPRSAPAGPRAPRYPQQPQHPPTQHLPQQSQHAPPQRQPRQHTVLRPKRRNDMLPPGGHLPPQDGHPQ